MNIFQVLGSAMGASRQKVEKPVDLIVANVLHDATGVEREVSSVKSDGKALYDDDMRRTLQEATARRLLMDIADQAALPNVLRALAAVGAPSRIEDIAEGIAAIRERQTAANAAGGR